VPVPGARTADEATDGTHVAESLAVTAADATAAATAAWAGLPPGRWLAAAGTVFRPAGPAVLGYLLIRLIGFTVMWGMARDARWPTTLTQLVGSWDGRWFLRLANDGYDSAVRILPNGDPKQSTLAFFPGYPFLVRWLGGLPGMTGLSAALLITMIAGAVAAWGIFEVGRTLSGSERVGTALALLWAVAPGSVVLQMAYSEALFTAVAAWALVAMLRHRWLTAGVLTFAAGLVRNTGLALVAALLVAALLATPREEDRVRRWAAVALSSLSSVGFLLWVGIRAHRLDGWFWLQDRAWGLSFDGGIGTLDKVSHYLVTDGNVYYSLTALVVLATLLLFGWSFTERIPLPLRVYTAGVLILALGSSGFFNSKPRFLLPAFLLAYPLAVLLARVRLRVQAVLFPVLGMTAIWYGTYVMTITGGNP
jgi:predicted DCC family thiol-disulfide oxidoreductase YuxK